MTTHDTEVPCKTWTRLPGGWEVWQDTDGPVTLGQFPAEVKIRRAGGAEPIPMTHTTTTPAKTVDELVFQALGEASMCWSNVDGAGVFQSDRAADIGRRLVADLRKAR